MNRLEMDSAGSYFARTLFIILLFAVLNTGEAFGIDADSMVVSPEFNPEADIDSLKEEEEKPGWTIKQLNRVLKEETGYADRPDLGWKDKKNSKVAMLCAVLFPGLGQMYNERPVKAAIAMGLETFYLTKILLYYRQEVRESRIRDRYPKYIQAPGNGESYLNSKWLYHDAWVSEYKERQIDWLWWSAGLLVALIFDAYVDAHLHDMNFEVENIGEDGTCGVTFSMRF